MPGASSSVGPEHRLRREGCEPEAASGLSEAFLLIASVAVRVKHVGAPQTPGAVSATCQPSALPRRCPRKQELLPPRVSSQP